jgi:hypothetical protein
MKPNIELHKPNKKSYTIIVWGVFLMLLIAQIFWLGREVEELKTTIEKQEKFSLGSALLGRRGLNDRRIASCKWYPDPNTIPA